MQAWPHHHDHHDPNRTNRIVTTEVADAPIMKASATAYQYEHPFMKRLTLKG